MFLLKTDFQTGIKKNLMCDRYLNITREKLEVQRIEEDTENITYPKESYHSSINVTRE